MISLPTFLSRYLVVRHNYKNPIDRRRASGLLAILWFIFIGSVLSVFFQVLPDIAETGTVSLASAVLILLPIVTFFLGIRWLQTGRLFYSAVWVFINLLAITLITLSFFDNGSGYLLTYGVLPVIIAGLLFDRRSYLLAFAVTFVSVLLLAVRQAGNFGIFFDDASMVFGVFAVAVAGIFFLIFGETGAATLTDVFDEVAQFHALGALKNIITDDRQDLLDVYGATLRLLRTELGFSFVQLYLVDNGRVSRRYRSGLRSQASGVLTDVSVGDASALAEAASLGRSVVLTATDNVIRRAHFLASTQYGIAVPVEASGQVIAVIDIQTVENAFTANTVLFLETFAMQLGMMIDRLRIVKDLRQEIEIEEQIIDGLRAQLRELRNVETRRVGTTWDSYLQGRGHQATGFDLVDANNERTIIAATDLPDEVLAAMNKGNVFIEPVDEQKIMHVPINVRGEVLGAMTFDFAADQHVSERQIELAQSVVNRLGLALENKRLFEQSQAQAIRERKANEVAGLLIGATAVEEVIALAAESFNEAIGAVSTYIRLDAESLTVVDDRAITTQNQDDGDATQ